YVHIYFYSYLHIWLCTYVHMCVYSEGKMAESPRGKAKVKRLDFRSLGRRRNTSAVHVSIEKDQTITDLKQFLRPGAAPAAPATAGGRRAAFDQEQDNDGLAEELTSSSSESEDEQRQVAQL